MDLNSKQSDTVIRLFSAALQTAVSEEEMMDTLRKLENEFGGTIPHWEDLLRRQLRADRLLAEEAALEKYLEERDTPAVLPAAPQRTTVERVYIGRDNRTDEEIMASHREYCKRRIRYVILTAFANTLYQKKKLSLKGYRSLEDTFAMFYGFGDSTVARRHSPPADSVAVPLHPRKKKRKPYTQHSPEYWRNLFSLPPLAGDDSKSGDEHHD